MRLSDFEGDEALDLLADIIDPACDILADRDFLKAVDSRKKTDAVKVALKNHKKAVTTIIARLNRQDPDTYTPNFVELPGMIFDLLNDPELLAVFTGHRPEELESSGDVTESTEETAEK